MEYQRDSHDLLCISQSCYLNSDGTLSADTIGDFESSCKAALELMNRNGELSQYNVIVPASQNVLSTSTINVIINIVPKGVAREIVVTIGFVASI